MKMRRPEKNFVCRYHRTGSLPRIQSMNLVVTILLVILLLGVLPTWPYSSGWGYFPSGGLGLVLLIVLLLAVFRRAP